MRRPQVLDAQTNDHASFGSYAIRTSQEINTELAQDVARHKREGRSSCAQESLSTLMWSYRKESSFTSKKHPRLYNAIKDGLLRAASHPEAGVRSAASTAIASSTNELITATLIELLGDGADTVRLAAAQALKGHQSPAATEAKLAILKEGRRGCIAALEGLCGTSDPNALEELAKMLDHQDELLKQSAFMALASSSAPKAVTTLVDALSNDPSKICAAVPSPLPEAHPSVVKALAKLLDHQSSRVKQSALLGLRGCKEPSVEKALIELIDSDKSTIKSNACRALRGTNNSAAIARLSALFEEQDELLHQIAAETLASSAHPEALEALKKALTHESTHVRSSAASCLVEKREKDVHLALLSRLKDADPDVRDFAAEGLRGNKDPFITQTLTEMLLDQDKKIRWSAAKAIQGTQHPPALTLLIQHLKDEHPITRLHAAIALQGSRCEGAVPALVGLLDDPYLEVRKQAGMALQGCDIPTCISTFRVWLDEGDQGFRLAAVKALEGSKTQETLPMLVRALEDKHSLVRQAAIKSLRDSSDPEAIEALVERLGDNVLHKCAEQVLASREQPEVFNSLLRRFHSETAQVRLSAAKTLIGCKNLDVIDVLISHLNSEDPNLIQAAAVALEGRLA